MIKRIIHKAILLKLQEKEKKTVACEKKIIEEIENDTEKYFNNEGNFHPN